MRGYEVNGNYQDLQTWHQQASQLPQRIKAYIWEQDQPPVNYDPQVYGVWEVNNIIQGVPKKCPFMEKTALTSFKINQNAKVRGVLENSGYLQHHGH